MKVHLENNLYLESDDMQYVIKKYSIVKSGKNEGEEYGETMGYFTDIHSALRRFMRMKLHESTASNLQELQEDLRRVEGYIKRLFEAEIVPGRKEAV